MLRSGAEHLETLRDGRVVYVGSERIDDVTRHPAFRNAAHTVAGLYDLKRAPEHQGIASFTAPDGETCSSWFLQPRSRDDLRKRTATHRLIAEATYGLFGRSPDHVAAFVTAMAMRADVFAAKGAQFGANITGVYDRMRREDAYAAYAVLPPQGARNPEFFQSRNLPVPTLRVVDEKDDGIVLSGMKMLATGGVFANYVFIGSIFPLAPSQVKESVTCIVPVGAPGVSLWSRKPMEPTATSALESPLAWRFDESDAMLMCENVKVPWEFVLTMDDPDQSRNIYIKTPGHSFGNHQSSVRFHAKLRLIVGLAARIAEATGADQIPAVRETLGRLASQEALLGGLIAGQIEQAEDWGGGLLGYNRRGVYAALNWCTENHSAIIDTLRELCGGGIFQMPADLSVMDDPALKATFETNFQTPQLDAVDRMRLFKLAWDLVGSEFAGRHMSYEKFYAGASHIVRNHSHREAPWGELRQIVDTLLDDSARG